MSEIHIEAVTVGLFEVNCYIAWREPNQALVVDPGAEHKLILRALREHELDVAGYLLTHGHADHLTALSDVAHAYPAPIIIPKVDAEWAFHSTNEIAPFYPAPQPPLEELITVEGGQELEWAGMDVTVIGTPGHTPGGVCYYLPQENVLFAGDTLFKGTVGRTDLRGGDPKQLAQSIKKLTKLPPETRVFPGHGEETTIGYELEHNFFMRKE
jgi:glyoxylase-like metal-dependent hydrolase (beta-lactamase superfamily II)